MLNHAFAFGVLSILMACGWPALRWRSRTALALLYGVFIEAVQLYLPTRFASVEDLAADMAGVALAFLLLRMLSARRCR